MFSFANIRQVPTHFSQEVFIYLPCEAEVVKIKKMLMFSDMELTSL